MPSDGLIKPEEIFRATRTLMEGHFLLTSGLHSPVYWEKFRILQYPEFTQSLCELIADHFSGFSIQVVAGPTTGGIIIAYEVARQLCIRSVYAEKEGDRRLIRRGFELEPGMRTLVVDDVLTTGGSIDQVISEVRRRGGEVIGVGVLVDRSQGHINFDIPFFSCHSTSAPSYTADNCPLCKAGIPLTEPGRGQA